MNSSINNTDTESWRSPIKPFIPIALALFSIFSWAVAMKIYLKTRHNLEPMHLIIISGGVGNAKSFFLYYMLLCLFIFSRTWFALFAEKSFQVHLHLFSTVWGEFSIQISPVVGKFWIFGVQFSLPLAASWQVSGSLHAPNLLWGKYVYWFHNRDCPK